MTDIFDIFINNSEENFDFERYLAKIGQKELFQPIFEKYGDVALAVRVIKFILYGFTPKSELLPESGSTWEKIAKLISINVNLPAEHFESIAHFREEAVQTSIQNWLSYQNDDNWTNYCTYRTLRQMMIKHCISPTDTEAIDVKSRMDAAKNVKDLLEMMNSAKAAFIQSHSKLKKPVEAITKVIKTKDTISVSDFAT